MISVFRYYELQYNVMFIRTILHSQNNSLRQLLPITRIYERKNSNIFSDKIKKKRQNAIN